MTIEHLVNSLKNIDTATLSLFISLAALGVSGLSALYGRRQAYHAFRQRVLLQYEPLKQLMDEVTQVCNKIESTTTVDEIKKLRESFVASIKQSELFLSSRIYKAFYALLDPFNEAATEKRIFIECGKGIPVPGGVMRPKKCFGVLEKSIIEIKHSIPRKIWKM